MLASEWLTIILIGRSLPGFIEIRMCFKSTSVSMTLRRFTFLPLKSWHNVFPYCLSYLAIEKVQGQTKCSFILERRRKRLFSLIFAAPTSLYNKHTAWNNAIVCKQRLVRFRFNINKPKEAS